MQKDVSKNKDLKMFKFSTRAKNTVTNKQICFVGIAYICIIFVIYCFYSAVIILFVNLELSRVQTYFYMLVVFCKNLFSFTLRFVSHILRFVSSDITMVDHVFTFKTDPEHTFSSRRFSIADMM